MVKRINDFQELIDIKIDELVDRKREAISAIEHVTESMYRAL